MNNTTRYAYWFDSTTYLVMLTKSYANTEVIVLILIFLLSLFYLCIMFMQYYGQIGAKIHILAMQEESFYE